MDEVLMNKHKIKKVFNPSVAFSSGDDDPIGDALRANAVAYWKLENVSESTVNALHLTNNNACTFVSGKVNNAVQCAPVEPIADSKYLSRSDSALLRGGDIDFYMALWFRFESESSMPIVNKYNSDLFGYDLSLYSEPYRFTWTFGDDGYVEATTFGVPSINTWYFVEVYHNASSNEVGIAVDNGAFDTASCLFPVEDNAIFKIGAQGEPLLSLGADCKVDELGVYKPNGLTAWLTSDKRDYLYNSGAGRTLYP